MAADAELAVTVSFPELTENESVIARELFNFVRTLEPLSPLEMLVICYTPSFHAAVSIHCPLSYQMPSDNIQLVSGIACPKTLEKTDLMICIFITTDSAKHHNH
jgi:hypothetical protein